METLIKKTLTLNLNKNLNKISLNKNSLYKFNLNNFTTLFKNDNSKGNSNNLNFKNKLKSYQLFNTKNFSTTPNENTTNEDKILPKVEDPFKKQFTLELSGILSNLKNQYYKNSKVNIETFILALTKVDRIEPETREAAEEFFLMVFRNENFYSEYLEQPKVEKGHQNFAELFNNINKISTLTEDDLTRLQKFFFLLDQPPKEFTIKDRTKIFDAFYYFKRNYSEENFKNISEIYKNINKSFHEFFTSFVHNEISPILQNLVFNTDEEIEYFVDRMVDRMSYILNPELAQKVKISFEKKLDLIQFYPRILHTIKNKNPELFKTESDKIERFLIENKNRAEEVQPELILCNISNFYIWNCQSEKILEAYIPFFYRNLASFKNEFAIELFFLILNSDLNKFENQENAVKMLNTIYRIIKNVKTHKIYNFEQIKEVYYFEDIRNKLENAFLKWDSKDIADSFEHPDHYYKKIFREFVKKSIETFPFAAIEYNNALFDTLFNNLKRYIKF